MPIRIIYGESDLILPDSKETATRLKKIILMLKFFPFQTVDIFYRKINQKK